jgi:hypothetical protein
MRSSRILALSLALIISVLLAACGGGGSGSKSNPTQPLTITSTVLTQATVNVPYTFVIQATGGSGTYTWAITAGTLPTGFTFDGSTALLGGTATTAGKYNFTIQVTDSKNDTASQPLTLTVGGAVDILCNSCFANTLTLPSGTPGVQYTASFTAMDGIGPYTWCVVEPNNGPCDNGSGGALPAGLTINSSTGAISGTPTTPQAPAQFTIQATDSEMPASVGSAQITISIFGVTSASLPAGEIYVPYGNQQLTVAGGTSPYTWCVKESNGSCDNGSGGGLPAGITLAPTCTSSRLSTCTISGTPTQAGTFNPTLQVTDSETPPAVTTAQFSVDIAGISNGLLKGNYVISLSGYQSGNPYVLVSAFVADGNGNVTSGLLDLNNGSGETINDGNVVPQTITPTGSTYNINSNGTGTLTLVTSATTYQFDLIVSGTACTANLNTSACGRVIQTAPTSPQMYGTGVLKVQDATYFPINQFFPGSFAFQAVGTDPSGNRFAAAGALAFDASTLVDIDCQQWSLSQCPMDQDSAGTAFYNSFKGSFSSTIDETTGRGNFADISYPNDPNNICQGTLHNFACTYAFYIVNKEEMILISADPVSKPANLTLWSAFRQTSNAGGWTLSSLTGNSIIELNALNPNGGSPQPDITAGVLNSNAMGTASISYDENVGGTLNQQQSSQGTYSIDTSGQKTGKITLSGFSGEFGTTPPILYMYGSNYGFVVGTDANVTSGVLEPQIGSPFSAASIEGPYAGGSTSPTLSTVTDSATFLYGDGVGTLTGPQYTVGSTGPSGPNNLDLTYTVGGTGRAVIKQGTNTYGIGYVVSVSPSNTTKKFVLLPAGNNPTLNVFSAGEQ